MLFTQKSGEEMSDFEKLMFTESYIKVLKKALREKEKNQESYKGNLHNILEEFKAFSPKFRKICAYKKEMKVHREKSKSAIIAAERLERKNYALRQKVRKLEGELSVYHQSSKGDG